MSKRIRDILSGQTQTRDDRRNAELSRMLACLDADGPIVVWLHGPVGTDKAELVSRFADSAAQAGSSITRVDCRTVEPTVSGFLESLTGIIGHKCDSLSSAAAALSEADERSVITFEHYEVFRLADSWLRREFIPSLAASARVLFVSLEPPSMGWSNALEWRDYFLPISLGSAVPEETADVEQRILSEAADKDVQDALIIASVVRRITKPVLATLYPEMSSDDLFDRFSQLSFVEQRHDGLALKESIRRLLSDRLQAADVQRYRESQRKAWRLLRNQLRDSARADLWRFTADAIFLIENPVIRDAFFPSQSAQFSVEPASQAHEPEIMAIAKRHESGAAVDALRLWWQNLPTAFHVVTDNAGTVAGFYCVAKPDEIAADWMQSDPVSRNWSRHLRLDGRVADIPALFLRRWLSLDDGESPSNVQAAAWVDIKRSYLELRPNLRRVYLALNDISPYGRVATELGFTVLQDLSAALGEADFHTAMLDFGPGSVDGWISNLLAAELGVADDQLLDNAERELILDGRRISLTPLEYRLVAMLESRSGKPVSRSDLLRQVWGQDYDGGSNVVDAVVRGLRKKCAGTSPIIETVRGVGYRLAIKESAP